MIDAILGSFEMLFLILENPKILLVVIPICIITYLCVAYL